MRRSTFLAATGGAIGAGALRARSAAAGPLRIGTIFSDPFGEPMYAQAAGLFRSAGLEVQLVPLKSSGAIGAALAGGSIDIGMGNPIVIASAREHGLPLRAFAPSVIFDAAEPTTLLMVQNGSPIRTAKQLEGRTVGSIEVGGVTQAGLRAWLTGNGVDPAKVSFVEIPFSAMASALGQGRIDAGFIAEPFLTAARATTRELGDPYGAIAKRWYLAMWFATESWLAANAATAERFAATILKAAAWENAHRAETATVLAEHVRVSKDVVAKMARARFAESYSPALLQPPLDAGWKYGILKRQIAAADIMTPQLRG